MRARRVMSHASHKHDERAYFLCFSGYWAMWLQFSLLVRAHHIGVRQPLWRGCVLMMMVSQIVHPRTTKMQRHTGLLSIKHPARLALLPVSKQDVTLPRLCTTRHTS